MNKWATTRERFRFCRIHSGFHFVTTTRSLLSISHNKSFFPANHEQKVLNWRPNTRPIFQIECCKQSYIVSSRCHAIDGHLSHRNARLENTASHSALNPEFWVFACLTDWLIDSLMHFLKKFSNSSGWPVRFHKRNVTFIIITYRNYQRDFFNLMTFFCNPLHERFRDKGLYRMGQETAGEVIHWIMECNGSGKASFESSLSMLSKVNRSQNNRTISSQGCSNADLITKIISSQVSLVHVDRFRQGSGRGSAER
jgi:hypothetical protein